MTAQESGYVFQIDFESIIFFSYSFSSSHEEISYVFPFVHNKPFKLAIGFAKLEFIFAVNGVILKAFPYQNSKQLQMLNSFQIKTPNDMDILVSSIEHFFMNQECAQFQHFSNIEPVNEIVHNSRTMQSISDEQTVMDSKILDQIYQPVLEENKSKVCTSLKYISM